MKQFHFLALVVTLLLPISSRAEITVLVHGYLSDGTTWERTGIATTLVHNGWQFAGHLTNSGIVWQPGQLNDKRFYIANLPFTAPLLWQADQLQAQINMLAQAYPAEQITLAGHSAGGVVARLMLVRHGQGNTRHLITIAAPHLGTPLTETGLEITDNHGPFEIVKKAAGGDAYKVAKLSRGLYRDLQPVRPGSLLAWLNMQPHPEISYTSILRNPVPGGKIDDVVPTPSQDMNQIPVLRGKSAIWTTPAPHYLRQQDGVILARLLNGTRPL